MKKQIYILFLITMFAFIVNLVGCSKTEYLITFDANGGNEVESVYVLEDQRIPIPSETTKEGYTFIGWYYGEDKWNFVENTVKENLTLVAKWSINKYTITFDTDGGSIIEDITQDYNTAVTSPANPTKEGYTFKGWDQEIPEKMPSKDIVLKAIWEINKYTITFDTDGGSEIEALTQDYNSVIVLPNNPTKEGYTFKGWDQEIPEKMPSEDIVLKAIWEINKYTITFNTDGGNEIQSIVQDYNSQIEKPENPVKVGYFFMGWDQEIPSIMPAKDMTIKAIWEQCIIDVGIFDSEIRMNETFKLNPSIVPSIISQSFIFESSDSSIVSVSDDGIVKGLKEGQVLIIIRSAIYKECYEQISITVTDEYLSLTGIKIEVDSAIIVCGESLQVKLVAYPANAIIGQVKWTVNNQNLATIDENGVLTAGNTEGIVKVTATVEKFTASKSFRIVFKAPKEYPDLGGYEIKIAQSTSNIGKIDPFMPKSTKDQYGYYDGLDRSARQDAWVAVEENYNCRISVVEYPADAPWGPSRWNYIVNQARLGTPQYDFYIVPDAQIPFLVSNNAILDLTSWYESYGRDYNDYDLMNTLNKTAGTYKSKLYSINTDELEINNIMGYNYDLWKLINQYDNTIEEPAKMFNDGKWTYTTFVEYSLKVQAALNSMYNAESGYYAVSGWPTYYWLGMVDRNGVGVADVTSLQVHLTGKDETAAGEALKQIYAAGAFDPAFSVDGGVASFNNGRALFNTGDLYFIGTNQDRWPDSINYGYVPFPAPDRSDPSMYYVGLSANECIVMAEGRNQYYKAYGEECTAENIYQAIMEYFSRAKENYQKSTGYDPNNQIKATAEAKFGASQESMKAFITMSTNLKNYAFYDPMANSNNRICSTYASDLDKAIRKFVDGTSKTTWYETVGIYQSSLGKTIIDVFS